MEKYNKIGQFYKKNKYWLFSTIIIVIFLIISFLNKDFIKLDKEGEQLKIIIQGCIPITGFFITIASIVLGLNNDSTYIKYIRSKPNFLIFIKSLFWGIATSLLCFVSYLLNTNETIILVFAIFTFGQIIVVTKTLYRIIIGLHNSIISKGKNNEK